MKAIFRCLFFQQKNNAFILALEIQIGLTMENYYLYLHQIFMYFNKEKLVAGLNNDTPPPPLVDEWTDQ